MCWYVLRCFLLPYLSCCLCGDKSSKQRLTGVVNAYTYADCTGEHYQLNAVGCWVDFEVENQDLGVQGLSVSCDGAAAASSSTATASDTASASETASASDTASASACASASATDTDRMMW